MEFTQQITDFLNNSIVLNSITLVLALLGVFFAPYFYFREKRHKVPFYIVRTINLLRESIQKINTVEITYLGKKIENLSISKIAFWNDGRETINSNDVASADTIKILIDNNFVFLDAQIIFQTKEANKFEIQIADDKKSINITFDYIDYKEGMVLQVFHNGNVSENISIGGTVKSVKKIRRKTFHFPSSIAKILRKILRKILTPKFIRLLESWTIFLTGIIFVLYFSINYFTRQPKSEGRIIFFVVILITVIMGIISTLLGYRMIARKVPKRFNIFNDEF
jgi:hypothetical protein